MSEPLHRIQWTLMERGYIQAEIVCAAAAPEPCRMVCPSGCEYSPCEHALVDSGYCNPKEWIDAAEVMEGYQGPTTKPIDGPIDFQWEGDGYSWHYAADCGSAPLLSAVLPLEQRP